jgi:hypothetical protein
MPSIRFSTWGIRLEAQQMGDVFDWFLCFQGLNESALEAHTRYGSPTLSQNDPLADGIELVFWNTTIRGFWLYSPLFVGSAKIVEGVKLGLNSSPKASSGYPSWPTIRCARQRPSRTRGKAGRFFKIS